MNKHQVKGTIKEAEGKIRKEAGDLTDNGTEEIKGTAQQPEGKAQKKLGDAKEQLRDGAEDPDKY